MLKHYFKIALRNIFKYKAYTIISAVCIALGMIIISFPNLYTYKDYNNRFINNHYYELEFYNILHDTLNSVDRIRTRISENEFGQIDSNNLNLFNKVVLVGGGYFIGNMRSEFNVKYKDAEENILPIKASVSYSNNEMLINENTSFLYGSRLINAPDEVIISKNFAKKISIGKNPVGAFIICNNQSYKIINVLDDDKITDKADLYFSIKGKELISKTNKIRAFVSLKEGVTKTSVNNALNSAHKIIGGKQLNLKVVDIIEYEDINYIKGMTLLLTLLILISALVTFLKYTFEIFYSKQRELVLRKISGSNAKGLFLLLYIEIFCVLAFAYLLSLVFVEVIFVFSFGLKFFGELFEIVTFKQIFYAHTIIIGCVLLISFVLVLIPIKKVRRISLVYTLNSKRRHNITRSVLIWLQLVISSILLLISIVDVGFITKHYSVYDTLSKKEKSKIIVVSLNSNVIKRNWNSIKNEIVNLPQIEHFAAVSMNSTTNAIILNSDTIRVKSICGSANYFNMFNIPFKGKLLNENESGYVYVNEALSELLKEKGNSGAIDIDGITYQIAGVYKNLYQKKLYDLNYSVFFINNNHDINFFKISMKNKEKEEIKNIEKIIRKYVPQSMPISINTLNIEMEIPYSYWIILALTLISIVLVILSIYTSISMEVRYRQKEMALRKINGATPKNIVVIFIKSYIVVFLLSFLSGFIIVRNFYSGHSLYQYLCDWKNVFISFLIILIILLLTTYWQIKKIMNVNPAEVLRKE